MGFAFCKHLCNKFHADQSSVQILCEVIFYCAAEQLHRLAVEFAQGVTFYLCAIIFLGTISVFKQREALSFSI